MSISGEKLPYSGTTVDIERTKGELTKLLKKYDCEGIQWTWINQQGWEMEFLQFVHKITIQGVEKHITFRVKVPDISQKNKGRIIPARNQAMRLVYHVMKNRLAAIDCGLESFEECFMSKILYELPDGRASTVGDIVLAQIEKIEPINLLPEVIL